MQAPQGCAEVLEREDIDIGGGADLLFGQRGPGLVAVTEDEVAAADGVVGRGAVAGGEAV